MGTAGTFPTVLVDDAYVIKFFGPFFNGRESAAIEREMYGLLATNPTIPAPTLLQRGMIGSDCARSWKYIISTQLAGESYGTMRDQFSVENRRDVAQFIAEVAASIHRLNPIPLEPSPLTLSWRTWDTFMERQIRSCTEQHRARGTLPDQLVDQIAHYLTRTTASAPPVHADSPVVMHCDLTEDHILGEWHWNTWLPTGVIDFGDARVGDRLYELVALHIECLGGDKDLLRVFLNRYGADVARRPDFSAAAMRMTLLHEFNVLETVCAFMPEVRQMHTLDQLATALWDVNA